MTILMSGERVREMATDTWVYINRKLEDPDENSDPWMSALSPWVADVYQGLLIRRRDRG